MTKETDSQDTWPERIAVPNLERARQALEFVRDGLGDEGRQQAASTLVVLAIAHVNKALSTLRIRR
jgi:hypothetical protein